MTSRRPLLPLVLLASLALWAARAPAALAQAPALETMSIDLWPDYDQPSVLVLLTGRLTAATPLPATVTLPLPSEATLNAVARLTPQGTLMADIAYELSATGDSLTLTTPDNGFRIEYYVPYGGEGLERAYQFNWQAPVAVTNLLVTVQQPAVATNLLTTPAPASVTTASNGLRMHNLPAQPLAPGETYRLDLAYTMASATLSVQLLTSPAATAAPAPDAPATAPGGPENWLLLAAGLVGLAAAAGAAFYLGRRSGSRGGRPATARVRRAKPAPRRVGQTPAAARRPSERPEPAPPSGGGARFCHQCGQPVTPGDRFCRDCGTKLKA